MSISQYDIKCQVANFIWPPENQQIFTIPNIKHIPNKISIDPEII